MHRRKRYRNLKVAGMKFRDVCASGLYLFLRNLKKTSETYMALNNQNISTVIYIYIYKITKLIENESFSCILLRL